MLFNFFLFLSGLRGYSHSNNFIFLGGEGGRVQVLVVAAQTPQNLRLVLKTALF